MFFAFASCNYLNIDDYIDEQLKLDSIFATKRYIEAYMWDAANKFEDEGNMYTAGYTPGPLATDEAFTILGGGYHGIAYVLGQLNADNLGGLNLWHKYYQIIRQCNTIVLRIDEASDWEGNERRDILAYTRFIRAYAYYNLLVNWGPIVILGDEVPENNADVAYYDRPRDLYDDCMEYVCTEFEAAAKYLPEAAESVMTFGRPTKGAAYALVARLRLIHASPLFNGSPITRTYYGNWTRKTDGKHYISQTPDPKRWAVAAAAAKRVMELKIRGMQAYELYTVDKDELTPELPVNVDDVGYGERNFPEGAGNIDPYRSYSDMFTGEAIPYVNKEFIWARASNALLYNTILSFPADKGGLNGICVTQKIVDAYEMADGRLRTQSSEDYPYTEIDVTKVRKSFSGYRLNEGVSNMYVNREMRFYASVGFSERFWPMLSSSESASRNQTVSYYNGSQNGRSSENTGYPATGYVITKYINAIDAWHGTTHLLVNKSFPIIRYAEILLSYAEALNALGGESYDIEMEGLEGGRQTFYRNVNEIKKYINQVRYRSGLPGLTDPQVADQSYVLSKIKKERMVEFLHENRRYYDVRRWGDYEESETQPIMGMNIAATSESFYQRTIPVSSRISERIVNKRLIFLPIPKIELKRVESFDQNPGW
jgi:hypothetical protein